MIPAQKASNEKERIATLRDYDLLDSLPEKTYDDITKIAADICGVPISLISLIDSDRQWFKSRVGLDAAETHRNLAFCAHAILKPEELFIVDDAKKDERFHDNPLVTGAPHIAFYAGVPLITDSGNALGTLCVIDQKPRELSKEQKETLKALARQIIAYFDVRRLNRQLQAQTQKIEELNEDLSKFVYVAAHDMKSPCNSLAMSASFLRENYQSKLGPEGTRFLVLMEETAIAASEMINGILHHTQTINHSDLKKESFTFGTVADEVKKLITLPDEFTIKVNHHDLELLTSRYIVVQALINLCNNAVKYNDKPHGSIELSAAEDDEYYTISVSDNGPGIRKEYQEQIFAMFATLGYKDRFNKKGTGIGLATVKRLVEKVQGSITVESEPGNGSTFTFTIRK